MNIVAATCTVLFYGFAASVYECVCYPQVCVYLLRISHILVFPHFHVTIKNVFVICTSGRKYIHRLNCNA
uniref:Secreted protein n=1 Tax=Anguilla anguilla TaxID=7936 RepID=A0A0E9QKI0_ANGAN